MAFLLLGAFFKIINASFIDNSCAPEWMIDSRVSTLARVKQLWAVLWRERRTFFDPEVLLCSAESLDPASNNFLLVSIIDCLVQIARVLPDLCGYDVYSSRSLVLNRTFRTSERKNQRPDDMNAANVYLISWIHYPKCGDYWSEAIFALLDEEMQQLAAKRTSNGVVQWLKLALIGPRDKAFFTLAFAQTLRHRNVSSRMRAGLVELFDHVVGDLDFLRKEPRLAWSTFSLPFSWILETLQMEVCRFPNGQFEFKMLTCALSGLLCVANIAILEAHHLTKSQKMVQSTRIRLCCCHE